VFPASAILFPSLTEVSAFCIAAKADADTITGNTNARIKTMIIVFFILILLIFKLRESKPLSLVSFQTAISR